MYAYELIFLLLITTLIAPVYPKPQEQQETPTPKVTNLKLKCLGKFSRITNSNQLYESLLPTILKPTDNPNDQTMKQEFLAYLTQSEDFHKLLNCSIHTPRLLQEDEDDGGGGGEDGVGGGFGNVVNTLALGQGNGNPYDNTNVLLGVRRILANVFTGNLVGIIQESVGLRSPEGVTNVFTDVLSTLFGSMATAGITGIVGNITTTISPYVNETEQEYLKQLYTQQVYIQQLQSQGVLDQAQAVALHHQVVNQRLQLQNGLLNVAAKDQQREFNKVVYQAHQLNQEKYLSSLYPKPVGSSGGGLVSQGQGNVGGNANKPRLPVSSVSVPVSGVGQQSVVQQQHYHKAGVGGSSNGVVGAVGASVSNAGVRRKRPGGVAVVQQDNDDEDKDY